VIPNIDRLLAQLDRKTQEVEIEARVVAATRSFARDIGTQFGFGWGNGTTAAGGSGRLVATRSTLSRRAPVSDDRRHSWKPRRPDPLFSNLPATSLRAV